MVEKVKEPYFNLMNIMKRQRVTQKELAELLQITPTTFNHKINRTSNLDFNLNEAKTIAEELNINISDFFD